MARLTTFLAAAASLSLVATPALGADIAAPAGPAHASAPAMAYDAEAEVANNHRYRDYRGYRYRNRTDVGDILTGVLVIGTVAAIANAATKNNRRYRDRDERDYRYRYPDRQDDYRYRQQDRRYDQRGDLGADARGMDRAVDMCVNEVERGEDRVATVDNARRTGEGWSVTGQLERGGGFDCEIDNNGRIRDVDINAGEYSDNRYDDQRHWSDSAAVADDRQFDDETYRSARAGRNVAPDYQGGYDAAPEDLGQGGDDDRYSVGQQGDFGQSG